jgi:hypothetical protein
MLLALAVPAGAAAKPGYEVRERALRLELSLPASNGYSVSIETEGHRRVTLTAQKAGVVAAYRTRGRVDRHGIEADFGKLGRISVRFRGERRPLVGPLPPGLADLLDDLDLPHRACHGRKPVREVGVFRGTVRFEGENGFTRVQARHAKGEVNRSYTRVCERYPGSAGKPAEKRSDDFDLRVSILYAADPSLRRKVSFEAVGFRFEGPLRELGEFFLVGATTLERKEGMLVLRKAIEFGDEGSVLLSLPSKSPVTATVALPGPFDGTAAYRKARGSPSTWEGSLSTRPPGAGLVPLTGSGFTAALCRVALSELADSRCLRRAGLPLPGALEVAPSLAARPAALGRLLAQGSGSQSQFFWDDRLSWSR